MIRPHIQELLDKTAIKPASTDQVRKPTPFKTAAVGLLLDPIEKFFSSYRSVPVRPLAERTEKMRIEWFAREMPPASLMDLDDCVVILHNHAADCPCYTNFGCRRVR